MEDRQKGTEPLGTEPAAGAEPAAGPAARLAAGGAAAVLPAPDDARRGPEAPAGPSRVCLVGNPNVGKSVLFGLLSGRYATVSNYPGTTVELARGTMALPGRRLPVVDTPGANSLIPQSEDERVTRDLLLEGEAVVLQVADSKNLTRALALTLQIAEAGLPFVLCLNMSDEAESRGIRVDAARLSRILGTGVAETVATRRKGVASLSAALAAARRSPLRVDYGEEIERALAPLEPMMPADGCGLGPRALALAALAGDGTLSGWLAARLSREDLAAIDRARRGLAVALGEPARAIIARRRLEEAERIANAVRANGRRDRSPVRDLGRTLGALTMHPLWGLPFVAAVVAGLFLFVGVFGAQTLVGWVEETLFGAWINPWIAGLFERASTPGFLTDLFVGPYGLITMGLTYAIAIVLPIVATFFLAFSALEDSGYLPRLSVMLNRPFRVMGLNGQAVLPMVLGLGCDTMATMTARILPTRKERRIVILLLALGVPCSAQLGVILGMLAGLSWKATAIWCGVVAGVLLLVGALAARVLPGPRPEFVLEIPPLRLPSPANLVRKTLARVEWYLREAVPLFLLGTLALFLADRAGLLPAVERAFEPVVTGILGLPAAASEAFLIGFMRRDFGAAGLYRLAADGGLTPAQVLVSLVTITLFIPCIANVFMIVKEQGLRVAAAVAAFVFPFAILVGGALNFVLSALGADLR